MEHSLERLLTPVSDTDPCGRDLRWSPAFTSFLSDFEAAISDAEGIVVGAETVDDGGISFESLLHRSDSLIESTKDIRILAIRAEIAWHDRGLEGFLIALEQSLEALARWPDPRAGIHPRADDEDETDLGERAAPLAKLLHRIPALAATLGWGNTPESPERFATATRLESLFANWAARTQAALGNDAPSASAAWQALRPVLAPVLTQAGSEAGSKPEGPGARTSQDTAPDSDAWDVLERACELMANQSPHSPAIPALRVVASWRSLDLLEVAHRLKPSGITLEAQLDAYRKYLDALD